MWEGRAEHGWEALLAEHGERQLGCMSPVFGGSPSGWPQLFQHQFRGLFLQKDPSLLIQTKSQLDVISDGKETLDMMWKHVVCTEELNHDLLYTTGATPILITFPA